MKGYRRTYRRSQSGAVLLVALVLLVILTLIGVSVMEGSVVQERMAGNALDKTRALQAAEAALREGERQASQGPATLDNMDLAEGWWQGRTNQFWLSDQSRSTVFNTNDAGLANQPRYVVEYHDMVCDNSETPSAANCMRIYRITSRGWGFHPNTTVTLQSIFSRR